MHLAEPTLGGHSYYSGGSNSMQVTFKKLKSGMVLGNISILILLKTVLIKIITLRGPCLIFTDSKALKAGLYLFHHTEAASCN